MKTIVESQTLFYKEFLMAREQFDPTDFGIDIDRNKLIDQMVDEFNGVYRDSWTLDRLLEHPREAIRFCEDFRRKYRYWDLPDDVILHSFLYRRKNPNS